MAGAAPRWQASGGTDAKMLMQRGKRAGMQREQRQVRKKREAALSGGTRAVRCSTARPRAGPSAKIWRGKWGRVALMNRRGLGTGGLLPGPGV